MNSLGVSRASTLNRSPVFSPSAGQSSVVFEEDNHGASAPGNADPTEGVVEALANAQDNVDGMNYDNNDNNRGRGNRERLQVRWFDLGILSRLAVGFALLCQGGGGPESYFFVVFGVVYYLYETGILENVIMRYFYEDLEAGISEDTNNDDGDNNANDGNAGRGGEVRKVAFGV